MTDTSTDRHQDSVEQFCRDFAAALDARGVSVREAAERSRWSKSAVGNARTGPRLPRLELVSDVLGAVGVDPPEIQSWTRRHAALAVAQDEPADRMASAPDSSDERRKPRFAVPVALLLVGLLIGGGIGYLLADGSPMPPAAAAVVTVQNKVALGVEQLVEDTGPAYLSAQPVGFCSQRGCALAATEVGSGALLPATCVVTGERMWNYNLDSPARRNPHRAESDRWYRIAWPDGRIGYLSEVYLVPSSRGGLGLPLC